MSASQLVSPELANDGVMNLRDYLAYLQQQNVPLNDALDIGAHEGQTVTELLSAIHGRVFAFEPMCEIPTHLRANLRVHWNQLALSDRTGTSRFSLPEDSALDEVNPRGFLQIGLAPVLKQWYGAVMRREAVKHVEVATALGDDHLPPDSNISFMKLDIQGGELRALKGLEQTLKSTNFLWVEYTGSQPGLLKYLRSQDFLLFESSYMFAGDPKTFRFGRKFEIFRTGEVGPNQEGFWARRTMPWKNFAAEFQMFKRLGGLIQTDLACIRAPFHTNR